MKAHDRLKKLEELRKRAAVLEEENKREVFVEHERKLTTKKDELRAARKKAEAEELLAKQEAEENGTDFDRQNLLKYTAEEVEEWEKRHKKKSKRTNNGFGDWDEANLRKHKKLIGQLKPNLDIYEEQKTIAKQFSEELLYRNADSLAYGDLMDNKPTEEAVDRLADDIANQFEASLVKYVTVDKRHVSSILGDVLLILTQTSLTSMKGICDLTKRYRGMIVHVFFDIRAFDKYTEEIRENLERGTAL